MSTPAADGSSSLTELPSAERPTSTAARIDIPSNASTTPPPTTPALRPKQETPSAPPPKPIARDVPIATPPSYTPSMRQPDVSEFDPFASPGPRLQPSTSILTDTAESSSTPSEPTFNFPGFLKDLRAKSAEPVARFLKSFLSNFAKKPFTVNEQIKLVHDFLEFISEKMVAVEPWKSQAVVEFENALEAMEKLVMNRLYNYTFTPQLVPSQPITTDDLERDAVFAQRVRLFGWIREKHLDVPEGDAAQGFLGFAEQELLKVNHYKAPRDKMICILNCCKVIFGLIRSTQGADATSADAFIPILIFVVLQANPDNMLSNVEYINRFRSPSKLQGEGGYYLSSLSGAISFIETMDASSLSNITQEEFEANVEHAIQELPPSPSSSRRRHMGDTEMSPFAPSTPGEEPARPLSFPALDNTRKFFQRTGSHVTEAVSKPINAISKILDGMQGEDGGEAVSRWQTGGTVPETEGISTPRRRAHTPESPSRRFAQLGISPGSASGPGTPIGEIPIPDFSSEQMQNTMDMSQNQYDQTRQAYVQTLHQMFPELEEDIVQDVLEGCGDDLGVAIDRLLEM